MSLGPDAARYLHAGNGHPVPRPFHLRFLLPWLLGSERVGWWAAWLASWPLLAAGMVWWQLEAGAGWQRALAAAVILCALPGILGPPVVIPVGVDLPATALGVLSAACLASDQPNLTIAAVVFACLAGGVKETTPVFAALWAWSPIPLVGLVVPVARHVYAVKRGRIGPDPLGVKFQEIADHPIRAALAAHAGRWRDGWLMVAPWGVALAGLYGADWRLLVVLAVAYVQLLVATDTVRLVQHAAGPALVASAVAVLPVEWLPLVCAVHVVWWFRVERV